MNINIDILSNKEVMKTQSKTELKFNEISACKKKGKVIPLHARCVT